MTYVTFSQAVAIPVKVLPAGTYTFQLADSTSGHHIGHWFYQSDTDGQEFVY